MEKEELILFFSEFWNMDKKDISDNLKLDSENLKNLSSIRFYQFIAAIESNFNVSVSNINNIITFQDLWKNIKDN
ncbi:hypothetical protein J4440_05205 [Candidatus Woesearchaeota archaeon]|nr:hypothetical protein [Candidatus Woesearchaeota archaeon]